MKTKSQKFFVLLIAAPLFFYVIFEAHNFWFYLQNQRAAVHYVLPQDYLGWVVLFEDSLCPKPSTTDQTLVYKIPDSGVLCVDSLSLQGFATDRIFHENRPEQNLLQHPGSKMNFVWYDHKFQKDDKKGFAFYVGYEVAKKDQSQLFDLLQKIIAESEPKSL